MKDYQQPFIELSLFLEQDVLSVSQDTDPNVDFMIGDILAK